MKMYIGGNWVDRSDTVPVFNPFDHSVLDTVPKGSASDVDMAIASAVRGAEVMARLSDYERYAILHGAADIMTERAEELAHTITKEEGKVIAEGRGAEGDSDHHPVRRGAQTPAL